MGKIMAPVDPKPQHIDRGEVEVVHEEMGEPMIEAVEDQGAGVSNRRAEDCATEESRD